MENWLKKLWTWLDYNRFFAIAMIAAAATWFTAVGCTPTTDSPLDPARQVNEKQLALDLKSWQAENEIMLARFEASGQDLQEQKETNKKIEDFILTVASGGIADLPGLATLLISGGALGAITDNIRKRGVIAGLKKNK